MDNDGFLIVEGRLDDIIISGGEKIIPSEIEKTILEIDAIKETKVFGLYDAKWGEKVCAIFISDENINEIEIQQLLKEKLPSYKIPKVILQVDEIPKNEMGKVDISILKKLFTWVIH